jgi:hypothetical protein
MMLAGQYRAALEALLRPYDLQIEWLDLQQPLPGSYWGEPEAGLVGNRLYCNAATPLHSVLHEAAHFVCMDEERRRTLERDAGGDDTEENAVCYLQMLWAQRLPDVDLAALMRDMDEWGYSFRLGSTARWFYEDATEAREWLCAHGLIAPA